MTDIDRRMKKTINLLMDENQKNEIVEFIRNADLYLDDIKYIIRYPFELTDENIKKIPKELRGRLIQYRGTLYTIYKGKRVPSDPVSYTHLMCLFILSYSYPSEFHVQISSENVKRSLMIDVLISNLLCACFINNGVI